MTEERIFIEVKAINPCIECTTFANCKLPCEKQQKWVESGYGYGVFTEAVVTRQEAIERMVLAMHNEEIKRSIKDIPCDYRNLAQAALNALLEVEK